MQVDYVSVPWGYWSILMFITGLGKIQDSPNTTNNTDFAPGKNGNLSGGKHINFPEAFLQKDSGVKIRLK
jgi:hypothetical protein